MGRMKDRQVFAALAAVILGLIAIPAIIGLGSLFVLAWLWAAGVHGGHGVILGWLSTKGVDKHGHVVWGVGRIVPLYFLGVVSAYLLYQVYELTAGAFRLFRDQLS